MLASMLSSSLFALSMLVSFGTASPLYNVLDHIRRQSGSFGITGVAGNGVQTRMEIRQMFQQQPDQFNLFVLAMQNFQAQAQSGKLSYYQIAGIHGVPNIPWDNVNANPNAGGIGYCTHSSVLFPAWHRPYIALFEQILYNQVQTVAQNFTGSQQSRYVTAAKNFRLPYWDWAVKGNNGLPTLPLVISSKTLNVNTPSGSQTIINPLFRFNFNPFDSGAFIEPPWNKWPVTLRYPSNNASQGDPQAVSQNDQAQTAIENNRANRAENLYNMFNLCKNYLGMSNDAVQSASAQCSNSLEGIHNGIHNDMGGPNGHMSVPWYAAFDAVFWMHHANVDRLFAMWQAIYPNQYGASQNAIMPTFTIVNQSSQGPSSPLTPFHDTSGNFFTTTSVRNWKNFGYTYPEFANSDGSSSAIMQAVNNLYGPNSPNAKKRKTKRSPLPSLLNLNPSSITTNLTSPAASSILSAATSTAISPALNPSPSPTSSATSGSSGSGSGSEGGNNNVYIANIHYPRYGLGSSYNIHIFLGPPSPSLAPADYASAANYIGSVAALANPGVYEPGILAAGAVPLTNSLFSQVHMGNLNDLARGNVVPHLKKLLTWRVVLADGTLVPNQNVPGLRVAVVTAPFVPASSESSFPTFGGFDVLSDVTTGKVGGLAESMVSGVVGGVTGGVLM